MLSLRRRIERELRDDVQIRFQRSEHVTSELINRLGLETELEVTLIIIIIIISPSIRRWAQFTLH